MMRTERLLLYPGVPACPADLASSPHPRLVSLVAANIRAALALST